MRANHTPWNMKESPKVVVQYKKRIGQVNTHDTEGRKKNYIQTTINIFDFKNAVLSRGILMWINTKNNEAK